MNHHVNSDSDVTSLAPSSPRSPKPPLYFVQSPSSRDSRDADNKSSSLQAPTPTYSSPMDSPSHPSATLASSASRVSGGIFRLSSSKVSRKSNQKAWPERNVIDEEGDYYYDDDDDEQGFTTRRFQFLIAVLGFVWFFTLFCLIIWGASRPYNPNIAVKSLTVSNFYFGQGFDYTGVPTKLLTVNCSVKMIIHNPATFFGIHVSSTPIDLFYSEIAVATGQLNKYFQPRKSQRTVSVNLKGNKVFLYGAGTSMGVSDSGVGVPLRLEFDILSQGNVVGKLVKTKHRRRISCSLVIDSTKTKAIKLKEDSCVYD